jgi:hypothetical protein
VNVIERGEVELVNTKRYPFNDSKATVALRSGRADRDYLVFTEVISADGEAGDVVVSDKAVNGFSIEYTGSAARAVVTYLITVGEHDSQV